MGGFELREAPSVHVLLVFGLLLVFLLSVLELSWFKDLAPEEMSSASSLLNLGDF